MGNDYIVMCHVSGGVTGTRQAPLKDNGKVVYFDTMEAAKAEAEFLAKRARSPYATANFSYVAMLARDY